MKNVSALSISALVVGLFGVVACDRGNPGDEVAAVTSAVTIPGTSVLGFEAAGAWSVSSGAVAQVTTPHTQGAQALQVTAPQNYTTLVSVPLSSGLAPLASMTDSGAALQLDLQLPISQPSPSYYGAIQLYISVPSKGVNNQFLGQTELTGQQLGTFQTYRFPMTDFVRSKLAGKTYSDLKFTIALNAPPFAQGKYLFDNLRSTSPAARPVGSIPSVDVTASLSTSPPANTPGLATFTAGTIQLPASFYVRVGSAGTGTAKFELGFGSTTSVSCTYNASADKTAYNFTSCTTGNKAGDIVAASFAKLTIVSADPAAPLNKIKAQLAYNLLGDQVGTKLVVPTPTYWGETGDENIAIMKNWGDAMIAAGAPATRTTLTAPIPDFVYPHGDPAPVNMLGGGPPPTPLDPPFNFRGALNGGLGAAPSRMFDAYYQLFGNVEPATAGTNFTSHFEATGVVGVRVLNHNSDVLTVFASVDTDNGGTDGQGSLDPHTTGQAWGKLFNTYLFNESGDIQSGITADESLSLTIDTPPIPVWIFIVKGGIIAEAGFAVNAALAINGFQVSGTPHASVSAHVFGGFDGGIAWGGVNVVVQLIGVQMPITARGLFNVNTSPGVCGATFDADVDAYVQLTSGGGKVELTGGIGICPACIEGSVPIMDWPNRNLGKLNFPDPFPIHIAALVIPLPDPSVCLLPLKAKITRPKATADLRVGVDTSASVSVTRPSERGTVSVPIDCSHLTVTWSTPTPGVTISPLTGSCFPTITFANSGPATLNVTAVNQYGETGSDSVTVEVQAATASAYPQITSPLDGWLYTSGSDLPLTGYVNNGNGPGVAVWTFDGEEVGRQNYTSGAHVLLPPVFTITARNNLTHSVVLTVTDDDGNGVPQSDVATFTTFVVR